MSFSQDFERAQKSTHLLRKALQYVEKNSSYRYTDYTSKLSSDLHRKRRYPVVKTRYRQFSCRTPTPMEVWADGSDSTGTIRAYGLDCSGYVDWVFNNALDYLIGHGGGAASQHTYCEDISWDEVQIGDLAFYPNDEHIGIVAGWDENGNILIVHCASGYNNVVITGKDGFTLRCKAGYFYTGGA